MNKRAGNPLGGVISGIDKGVRWLTGKGKGLVEKAKPLVAPAVAGGVAGYVAGAAGGQARTPSGYLPGQVPLSDPSWAGYTTRRDETPLWQQTALAANKGTTLPQQGGVMHAASFDTLDEVKERRRAFLFGVSLFCKKAGLDTDDTRLMRKVAAVPWRYVLPALAAGGAGYYLGKPKQYVPRDPGESREDWLRRNTTWGEAYKQHQADNTRLDEARARAARYAGTAQGQQAAREAAEIQNRILTRQFGGAEAPGSIDLTRPDAFAANIARNKRIAQSMYRAARGSFPRPSVAEALRTATLGGDPQSNLEAFFPPDELDPTTGKPMWAELDQFRGPGPGRVGYAPPRDKPPPYPGQPAVSAVPGGGQ